MANVIFSILIFANISRQMVEHCSIIISSSDRQLKKTFHQFHCHANFVLTIWAGGKISHNRVQIEKLSFGWKQHTQTNEQVLTVSVLGSVHVENHNTTSLSQFASACSYHRHTNLVFTVVPHMIQGVHLKPSESHKKWDVVASCLVPYSSSLIFIELFEESL